MLKHTQIICRQNMTTCMFRQGRVAKACTKGFPVRVRLLPMCRGELSAVIARLLSKYL